MPTLLLRFLLEPSPRQRIAVAALLGLVLVNLFYQGQQPYAVGLFTPPWDKLAHMTLFGGMAGLLWIALGARFVWPLWPFAAVVGAADEFAQQFNPGRSVSLEDWLTDLAGATLAAVVVFWVRRRWNGVRVS